MTIGFLVPRSGIYPAMNFDLVAGLKAGLAFAGAGNARIITENIGFATDNQAIYAHCERLLLDGADFVAGYVNPSAAEILNSLFANANRFFIALDSGYHFPALSPDLTHIITLSLQGTLCCRIAARLAVSEGGKQFAFTGSFYDAGYRSPFGFARGAEDAGAKAVFNHITALKRAEFTLEPLSRFLEATPPDVLFSAFCGDMAESFYHETGNREPFISLKTFVSPFMAEEQLLDKVACIGNNTYTVIPWGRALPLEANRTFMAAMQEAGRPGNIFSVLAWECALVINHLAKDSKPGAVHEPFTLDSPRGPVQVYPAAGSSAAPAYRARLVKNPLTGRPELTGIAEAGCTEEERRRLNADIRSLQQTQLNTWHNAYPCID